ncbi:MAG: hypothetical protein AB7V27_03445 [Candidatus Binatia bacterium]
MRKRCTRYRAWAVALSATLLAGCGAGAPRLDAPAQPPMIITFWCAPPLAELNEDRVAEIAAAGFTIIGAPCEGVLDVASNRRALELVHRYQLGMWVADHRIYAAATGDAAAQAQLAAVVADYRDAPALRGYMVLDEPAVDGFPAVAITVAGLRDADPERLAYVNLLPDYVPPHLLGAPSYADYLEQFAAQVRPQMLSVDYYPFGEHKDRSTFFANLGALRSTALRHDLPFMWIALAMPHGPYRDPTEAELAWQLFHALAFGARGVSYFTYWTPPGGGEWNFRNGLIEHGRPTVRYFQAAQLNRQLRAIGDALAAWRSIAIADSRGEIAAPFPIGPIAGIDGGAVTVGLFADGRDGIAALLVNRDYRESVTAVLHPRAGAPAPEELDLESARWQPAASLRFELAPGRARLLRWSAARWQW